MAAAAVVSASEAMYDVGEAVLRADIQGTDNAMLQGGHPGEGVTHRSAPREHLE